MITAWCVRTVRYVCVCVCGILSCCHGILETAEFRNFLADSMPLPRARDEDESSEDSMEAVEQAYKQLALSKTNTIPVGYCNILTLSLVPLPLLPSLTLSLTLSLPH